MTTMIDPPAPAEQQSQLDGDDQSSAWWRLAAVGLGTAALGLVAGVPVLLVVLAIVFMIFMHELGHYLTARAADMKVTEFFIGFGPRIWSFRRGETEYGLKGIPAGAYVRIIGMTNLDEVEPVDEARAYRQKPYWRRMSVALAGSAMHFLMAIALLFTAFAIVGVHDAEKWFVNDLTEDGPAEQAGIEIGDRIVELGGVEISEWSELVEAVEPLAGSEVEAVVERDGRQLTIDVLIGERLSENAAAGIGGVIEGDILRTVDGVPVRTYADFADRVSEGERYEIELQRGTDILVVDALVKDIVTDDVAIGLLGVTRDFEQTRLGLGESVVRSLTDFGSLTKSSVTALGSVFSPGGLGDFVGGAFDVDDEPSVGDDAEAAAEDGDSTAVDPDDENRILSIVGGVRIGAQATEDGLLGFLSFMITLNIFVGVFNLIPLLPLDGGHVAIATYEKLRSRGGRKYHADVAKLMPLTYAVVFVLVAVGLIAIYRDILDPVNLPS